MARSPEGAQRRRRWIARALLEALVEVRQLGGGGSSSSGGGGSDGLPLPAHPLGVRLWLELEQCCFTETAAVSVLTAGSSGSAQCGKRGGGNGGLGVGFTAPKRLGGAYLRDMAVCRRLALDLSLWMLVDFPGRHHSHDQLHFADPSHSSSSSSSSSSSPPLASVGLSERGAARGNTGAAHRRRCARGRWGTTRPTARSITPANTSGGKKEKKQKKRRGGYRLEYRCLGRPTSRSGPMSWTSFSTTSRAVAGAKIPSRWTVSSRRGRCGRRCRSWRQCCRALRWPCGRRRSYACLSPSRVVLWRTFTSPQPPPSRPTSKGGRRLRTQTA